MSRRALFPILTLALASPLVAQGPNQQTVAVNEWQVPWPNTRPRDPFVDAQGRVWFVGQEGHYVAMLTPATGQFRRYDLEPGAGPHNLIVAPDGMVWFSGNLVGYIGRLDPGTGAITKYPMPDTTVRDPHTLVFDRAGDIWFSAQNGNVIGKLTVRTGEVRLIRVPTPRARPYGIMLDPRGTPWVVLFGTNKIASVNPATMELTEHVLPRPETRPRRIAITSDGGIWYGDYAAGMLGRLDPATGRAEEWPLPGGARSRPYAMAVDNQDRVYVAETGAQPNRFAVFDARTKQFVAGGPVPSGGGTVRHMVWDAASGDVWFGADVGTIGRARVAPAAAVP